MDCVGFMRSQRSWQSFLRAPIEVCIVCCYANWVRFNTHYYYSLLLMLITITQSIIQYRVWSRDKQRVHFQQNLCRDGIGLTLDLLTRRTTRDNVRGRHLWWRHMTEKQVLDPWLGWRDSIFQRVRMAWTSQGESVRRGICV